MVISLSTNQAQCKATKLTETNALPLSKTTTCVGYSVLTCIVEKSLTISPPVPLRLCTLPYCSYSPPPHEHS